MNVLSDTFCVQENPKEMKVVRKRTDKVILFGPVFGLSKPFFNGTK